MMERKERGHIEVALFTHPLTKSPEEFQEMVVELTGHNMASGNIKRTVIGAKNKAILETPLVRPRESDGVANGI